MLYPRTLFGEFHDLVMSSAVHMERAIEAAIP